MDTLIDNKVFEIMEELSQSKKPVVIICDSDFDDFWSQWVGVIEKLRNLKTFKVRCRTKVYQLPMGNSDGEVSHVETHTKVRYYLTVN